MRKIRKMLLAGILAAAVLSAGCGAASTDYASPAQGQESAEPQEPVSPDQSRESAESQGPVLPDQSRESAKMRERVSGQNQEGAEEGLAVTFLDVGQGNAVLVENDGQYMLIDGGDRDNSSYVVSYLEQRGVEELAYVVSSHYDADHLNGVVGALHAFSCDTLLAADYTTDTRVYDSFCSIVEEKGISIEYPDMGEVYSFGDVEFTVVCPDAYDYSDDNDNSVGIRLVYGDTSFLICGDAGSRVEQMMLHSGLTIASDVYLASHHGSAGSSSLEFLEAVGPEAVVISAGLGNSYGHPSEAVLSNIEEIGADLYRTDLQGEITVVSDGSALEWSVEPCADYRSGEEIAEKIPKEAENRGKDGAGAAPKEAERKSGSGLDENSGDAGTEETYVLNLSTKKFHLPTCGSVGDMNEENKAEFTGSRKELVEAGYSPCGRCRP